MPRPLLYLMAVWVLAVPLRAAEPAAVPPELDAYLKRASADMDPAEAALWVCRAQYRDIDVPAELKKVDALAEKLRPKLRASGTVAGKLAALATFLFEEENFGLPKEDTAAAFLLSDVLRDRRGNCLGLSVLCLALAHRVGLKLHGVPAPSRGSGPGHLLVRYDDGAHRVNFDPTERGAAHDDTHYRTLFNLTEADLKDGYILGNVDTRAVINLLLVNLGGALVESGDGAAAAPLLVRALDLNPSYAPAHLNLGSAYLTQLDLEAAEKAYRRALQLDPKLVGAQLGLAEVALNRGKADEAETAALTALGDEPDNLRAKALLANVQLQRQQFHPASMTLKEIVATKPADPVARCNLGRAQLLAGDFADAEATYRKAIALDEKNADAYHGLGLTMQAVARADEARACFVKALELKPTHAPTRLAQADAALQRRDLPAAERAYRAVLEGQPRHTEALVGLMDALQAQGKHRDAETLVASALEQTPNDPTMTFLLGQMKFTRGDFRGALPLFEKARPHAAAAQVPGILQRMAVCHVKLRQHAKALELAKELLTSQPNDRVGLQIAGTASEALRQPGEAAAYYKKVLELYPEDDAARKGLARVQRR